MEFLTKVLVLTNSLLLALYTTSRTLVFLVIPYAQIRKANGYNITKIKNKTKQKNTLKISVTMTNKKSTEYDLIKTITYPSSYHFHHLSNVR